MDRLEVEIREGEEVWVLLNASRAAFLKSSWSASHENREALARDPDCFHEAALPFPHARKRY